VPSATPSGRSHAPAAEARAAYGRLACAPAHPDGQISAPANGTGAQEWARAFRARATARIVADREGHEAADPDGTGGGDEERKNGPTTTIRGGGQ